ncbi:hypothetical protein [Pseudonocardia broussonetiae]|uniref:CopG family transcriptional regulator n=1 Tax=Pseudonocardia broussonetiae TaxID=2736640 RepID=A0A6M6JVX3_9PSEU|nr:hypothetical protein [Pseudonocardia broussonetiae]QJY51207.1 hypothetical protein HOP40_35070 [Pseudonocardia broussonetiae]
MSAERVTVSFEPAIAQRVRQCGSRVRGGQSGYLARLVQQDAVREAGEALALWYAEQGGEQYVVDALTEAAAAQDQAS